MHKIDDYIKYISPRLFFYPKSDHGVMHTYRVMVLATELANRLHISPEDYNVLMCACCYHDIGRWHDFKDEKHGLRGANKCKRKGLLDKFNLTPIEQSTVLSLIECHAKPDKAFYIRTQSECLLYEILKDADALDRWRFKKMDASYLRLPESKELSDFAKDLVLKYPYNYKYKELGIKQSPALIFLNLVAIAFKNKKRRFCLRFLKNNISIFIACDYHFAIDFLALFVSRGALAQFLG